MIAKATSRILGLATLALLVFLGLAAKCSLRVELPRGTDLRWVSVAELPNELEIHPTVFWEPLDTVRLRELLSERPSLASGKRVLEIGTGSGLLALCCAEAGAEAIVATDINPYAIRCARANARRMQRQIDFRLVSADDGDAFAVVSPHEQFDLIISNPPWENGVPEQWSEYALYDPGFQLLRSILANCHAHLRPGGRVILAYGCVDAVRAARKLCEELNLQFVILDDRDPAQLPNLFLPGMMLGIGPLAELR